MNGTTAPQVVEAPAPLTNPFAPGNKGIWASLLTMAAAAAAPTVASKLQIPPEQAVGTIGVFGLSLQYLFARLRDRRRQKKLAGK